jgi:hypothetical protein
MSIEIRRSTQMGNKRNESGRSLPVANYSSAIARAVDWLGDRYLLAKPINARPGRGTRAAARTSGQKAA